MKHKQSIRLPAALVPKARKCLEIFNRQAEECSRIAKEAEAKMVQITENASKQGSQLWYELVEAMGFPDADYKNGEWIIDVTYADFGIVFLNQKFMPSDNVVSQEDDFLDSAMKEITKTKPPQSKLN